jgi:phospholipid transport system substrate-binding protein
MSRRLLSLGVIAVAFGLFAAAPPSEAAMDPNAFINNLGQEGIQSLGPNVPPQQRSARFRQLFEADFDVADLGRFAIGRYWRALNPAQQQEFLQLYREYTVQAYVEKLGKFGGAQFRVIGSEPSGDGVVVNSEAFPPGGNAVRIDWHLVPSGDGYKVNDVMLDQVSMKVTQRDEFARIIQNNGGQPSALLAVMRQQLRGGGTVPTAAPSYPAMRQQMPGAGTAPGTAPPVPAMR